MMVKDFDAVVVGAGNAGLTAATALQRGGAKTLLLERHNIPGGCGTSFVRGDFEFEVALHQLSGMGTEEEPFLLRHLFEDLGILDRLEIVTESELYRTVLPGEVDITLPADWHGIQEVLLKYFPDEKEQIPRFMEVCESICIETFTSVPRAQKNNDSKFLENNCPAYKEFGLRSAKDVMDDFFKNEDLKLVLGGYWCYIGMPPKDISFADLAGMFYAYAKFKPTHVKGGSQAISSALLESFQEAGGVAKFNCGAVEILHENNRILGIISEDGMRYSCKSIVSNASPIHTYYDLMKMEEVPDDVATDLKSRRIGTSAFVLYLGLDCSPEKLGINTASTFIVTERDESIATAAMKSLEDPKSIMVTCYNIEDPEFAPPEKTSLSVLYLQYSDPWLTMQPEKYYETKYAMAKSLIELAETTYPGIQEHLEQIEVATPLTMMRYLNTPGGAIYGFEQNIPDGNVFRERLKSIDGLYASSAWNNQGGFQPTYMNGASTARAVLKYIINVNSKQELEFSEQ